MDDPSLMVSAMRSTVAVSSSHRNFFCDSSIRFSSNFVFISQVMQKCHVGLGRMERAEAQAAEWAVEKERLQSEKEELQKPLEAKGGLLSEEVSKNASLAADSIRLRLRWRG